LDEVRIAGGLARELVECVLVDVSPRRDDRLANRLDRLARRQVDATIAKPSNQAKIHDWLANGAKKTLVLTSDLGHEIGYGVRRTDVLAGVSNKIPSNIANVVFKADPSFPEGYKILTAFPEVTPKRTPCLRKKMMKNYCFSSSVGTFTKTGLTTSIQKAR